MKKLSALLSLLSQSKIALLGAVIVTTAVFADILLVVGELFFFESNPYIGIVVYVVFPSMAMAGLALIPVGVFWRGRKRSLRPLSHVNTLIERKKVSPRHVVLLVMGLSCGNLVLFSVAGYRGLHYTESVMFCGQLCHQPMNPEFTTHSRSPHSEIPCVECHIGSGASYFIKSKLDGTRQLLAMVTGNYSKPIPTPVHNLRPARDVCEVCHKTESFHGNRIDVNQRFASDEQNTRTYTILNLRVGGGTGPLKHATGIHSHVSEGLALRYFATDERREKIVRVEMIREEGEGRVFTLPGFEAGEAELDEEHFRVMDCIDCHNRPTHIYLPPDKALDEWMADGLIDATIPWIRKLSEEVITRVYETREAAIAGINELPVIYKQRYPEHWEANSEKLATVVAALQEIHATYVHPDMNIQWNTYPSLIGHPTPHTSACFRCHGSALRDKDGLGIGADCETCHFILADNERNPMILRMLEDS